MLPPPLPDPFAFVQNLWDDAHDLDVENKALDYVEQALGRRYFEQHWERRSDTDHERDVRAWLEEMGYDPEIAGDVTEELRRLYQVRARWPR